MTISNNSTQYDQLQHPDKVVVDVIDYNVREQFAQCQRRTKNAPYAGEKVHHLAGFGRSKRAPLGGTLVCP